MRLDLLESLINAARGLHFFMHLAFHEVVPKLVDVEIVSHLELSGVFALIGGSFSDLLILLLSLNAALDRLFFVCNAALKLEDTLLTVTLLLLNVLHQVVEDGLGLQLRFFCCACL